MTNNTSQEKERVWRLIKNAKSVLLVTLSVDQSMNSRPMGCLHTKFDGTLWFITFKHTAKIQELATDDRVLVSYAEPTKYEYISVSGRARLVEDKKRVSELWYEGLRVWFPDGPDDPELALVAVDVESVKYWTNAASIFTYAWLYLKSRWTGKRPSFGEVADVGEIKLK